MKLEGFAHQELCEMAMFQINGVEAVWKDFGEKFDRDSHGCPEHGCGDMEFTRVSPRPEVLDKYGITEEEYNEVCDELEDALSFGYCDKCR